MLAAKSKTGECRGPCQDVRLGLPPSMAAEWLVCCSAAIPPGEDPVNRVSVVQRRRTRHPIRTRMLAVATRKFLRECTPDICIKLSAEAKSAKDIVKPCNNRNSASS